MYKVIVFDIGDTLIGYEPDAKKQDELNYVILPEYQKIK